MRPKKKLSGPSNTNGAVRVPPVEQISGTELLAPGVSEPLVEIVHDTVDTMLLDEAVRHINGIHAAKGLETARAVGEYLLKTFFSGSLENFTTDGKRNPSFRALAEREDLKVGHSSLWYSVAVLEQLRQLPAEIGGALPMSHHRMLLPIKDVDAKLELATKAVAGDLSKAVFAEEVRAVRKTETETSKSGRPALPSWAKGIGDIRKLVEAASADHISKDDIAKKATEKLQTRLQVPRVNYKAPCATIRNVLFATA